MLDTAGQVHALSTPGNDGFYYDNFTSPVPWVSWQDVTQDYRVGLASDQGIRAFQGWRGDGTQAPCFSDVRSQIAFGVLSLGLVRDISYLALGNFATVQAELTDSLRGHNPLGALDVPSSPR